jgi:hypothetical protein
MCSCRKKTAATATATKWVVSYPGGGTETKSSEMAAKLASGKVPGATYSAKTS